jgi:hypothetical protein
MCQLVECGDETENETPCLSASEESLIKMPSGGSRLWRPMLLRHPEIILPDARK